MAPESSVHQPGRVGRYRLIQRLGEGGMGVVHLGLDPEGRAVAVKVLRAHIAADPDARLRLAREVATLRRVRHPRVAAVLDADVECEVPFLVTTFVPGKPLDAHVRDHGPLPRGHVARVGAVLAEALRAIHQAGVVHRDVKPANVMLLDGEPVLIDFGIAHVADESRITHTGLVMGTPGYLSPEIIGGEPVTSATDWWGWGATLAFAATGRPPFGTGPIEVVLDRVRRGQTDITGVDAGLRATLTAALAVDPARRPAPERLVAGLAAVPPGRGARPPARGATIIDLTADGGPSPDDVTTARTPPPGGRDEAAVRGTSLDSPALNGAGSNGSAAHRSAADNAAADGAVAHHAAAPGVAAHGAAAQGAATVVVPPPVGEAATVVVPPPVNEAATVVVPPPAPWGSPPDTRRFDPPGGAGPANGFAAPNAQRPNPAATAQYSAAPVHPSPGGQYSSQPGQYPSQPGHSSQPGQYPPQPGQYPSQPGQYPPEGAQYPPPAGTGRQAGPSAAYAPSGVPPAGLQPAADRPGGGRPTGWPPQGGEAARPAGDGARADVPAADPTRGVLVGLLAAIAAVAAVAPYGGLWIAVLGIVGARVVDRSSTALLVRRDQHGPRGSDGVLTVLALPWRLVTSSLATVLWLILPILIGISVAFIAAGLAPGGAGRSIPAGEPGGLGAGMVALLLTAWFGPGGAPVRRGTTRAVRFVTATRRAQVVVWSLIALVLVSAVVVAGGEATPDWGPLEELRIVRMLTNR